MATTTDPGSGVGGPTRRHRVHAGDVAADPQLVQPPTDPEDGAATGGTTLADDVVQVLADVRAAQAQKAPKAARVHLVDNPEAYIPTMGIAKWLYWLMNLFNLADAQHPEYFRVPKLGKKEQALVDEALEAARLRLEAEAARAALVAERARLAAIAAKERYIKLLSLGLKAFAVAGMNSKGGGATTTTTGYMTSVLSMATQRTTVALDANQASGNLARLLGVLNGTTHTMNDLARDYESLGISFRDFIMGIAPTPYWVRVVSARAIIEGERSRLEGADIERILPVVLANAEQVVSDTPNDMTNALTRALVDKMGGLFFTANVQVVESMRQLVTTMESLRKFGYAEKVNEGLIVFSNLPAGADIQTYIDFMHKEEKYWNIQPGQHKGPILGIPHDDYIAKDEEVCLEALAPETLDAYRDAVIAMLEVLYMQKFGFLPPAA